MGLLAVQQFTEDHLASLLSDMFQGVSFNGRFSVRMIDDALAVIKGKIDRLGDVKETYEIYFDDEFVSSFDDSMAVQKIDRDFLSGFMELYRDETIFLHKEMYEEKANQEKYAKMMADAAKLAKRDKEFAKLSTDEKEIAHETLKQLEGTKNAPAK